MTLNAYHESLVSHATRLKSDSEDIYNICMKIRMSNLTSEQLEMFREIESKLNKMHEFVIEVIKTNQ